MTTPVYQNTYNNTLYGFTKGSLPVTDANGKILQLPVGSDGYVLTLDSTQPLGVKWSAETAPFSNTVPMGGTGDTSFTQNAVLLGNGTNPLKAYPLTPFDDSIQILVDDTNKKLLIQAVAKDPTNYHFLSTSTTNGAINFGDYYICDQNSQNYNYGLFTLALTGTPDLTQCPVMTVVGDGTHNWKISLTNGITVHVGNQSTTSTGSGFISSTDPSDAVELVYVGGSGTTGVYALHVKQGNIAFG